MPRCAPEVLPRVLTNRWLQVHAGIRCHQLRITTACFDQRDGGGGPAGRAGHRRCRPLRPRVLAGACFAPTIRVQIPFQTLAPRIEAFHCNAAARNITIMLTPVCLGHIFLRRHLAVAAKSSAASARRVLERTSRPHHRARLLCRPCYCPGRLSFWL